MNAARSHLSMIETDYPLAEILDRCVDLATRIEAGTADYADKVTLLAHVRTLREDLDLTHNGGRL